MNDRVTPDEIRNVAINEVFVFGSNESGRHGKGAAKDAMKFGAVYGQAAGLQGRSYGIPTKNASITNTLSLTKIKVYVDEFVRFASSRPDLIFLVTKIGCGLAGLSYKEVAPLFVKCRELQNVMLPREFWRVISHMKDK